MTHNSYKAGLFTWTIFRFVNCQPIAVGRFRSRSDAEGHLQVLRRLVPGVEFAIAFTPSESSDDPALMQPATLPNNSNSGTYLSSTKP